jgi:class 3 adenylate cyclase/tetratricopeptide (TPR) repeat protein
VSTCPTCSSPVTPGDRFCSHCGAPLADSRPVKGERKVATVLFADVARSTALAEQLDPEDWAAVMNGAFSFMNSAVTRYGGTVGRLMGDAVLAFFGAPIAHEDHAERAVHSGLAIRDAAAQYAQSQRERWGIEFGIRVGISTGTAVLAVLGDEVRAEYTAMGDTANTAARLQGVAQPGTVLISRSTHRLVRGQFEVRSVGSVALKGKSEEVEAYEVLAAREEPIKARGIEGLRSPLVGRDAEIAELRLRIVELEQGHGHVVALVGDAGLGKSRLVAELRDEVQAADDVPWFEGRSVSYARTAPYYPWQQIGRQFIGASPADGPDEVRKKLHSFVGDMGLAWELLPFYETILAVESETSALALSSYQGKELVDQTARSVTAAIRAAMQAGGGANPCIIVFDDLHWADSASVELVAQVAELAVSEPLLLVCVLRPDRRADSWGLLVRLADSLGDRFQRLDLLPLPERTAAELLENLVHADELPTGFHNEVLKRAEGNPFFLEEVLRSQIDSGHLVSDGERWRATEGLETVAIPDTLAGVLTARIDRLPDTTKRVAQTAAVIGRIFPYRALATVCRDGPPAERVDDVEPHLGTLTLEELVRERAGEPEREFIFKHALTCEAAYDLLLRDRRRELHLRTARALEELYPDRQEELAPVLAYHYHWGGDAEQTARHSVRAAERALKLFAVREALEHYDRAYVDLDALDDPPAAALIDAILGWITVRYKLHEYDGAMSRLERAETLARAVQDNGRLARVLSWVASLHIVTGTPSKAGDYLVESNKLANQLGDERLTLLPFFFASDSMIDRSPAAAAEQLGQVVELSRKYNVPEIEGHALASKAMAHARIGEFDTAEEHAQLALAAAHSGGHRVKEADVHIFLAGTYYDMGDVEKGLEHARIGAQIAAEENAPECACAGFYGVGVGSLERKDLEEAVSYFSRSKRFADSAGWRAYLNRIRGGAATAELEQGIDGALGELETALANARADHDEYAAGVLAERLARAQLNRGHPDEAEPYLDAALSYYRTAGMRPYTARALDLAARIHEARGHHDRAEQARSEAEVVRAAIRPARATLSTGPGADGPGAGRDPDLQPST